MTTRRASIFLTLAGVLFIFFESQAIDWGNFPRGTGTWIKVEELDSVSDHDELPIRETGGVTYEELQQVGFAHIGAGALERGYFSFPGDWELILVESPEGDYYYIHDILMWPPRCLIIPEYVNWPDVREETFTSYLGCGCGQEAYLDTMRLIYGLGFAEQIEAEPPFFWPQYAAYIVYRREGHICLKLPCGNGGQGYDPKNYLYFTDSLYNAFPDTLEVILSGDSPLYLKAQAYHMSEDLTAWLWLETQPDSITIVPLNDSSDGFWYGKYDNSRKLGLKSFNTVRAELHGYYGDTLIYDCVDVCLPKLVTSADTVVINHANMKISQDFTAGIEILHDETQARLKPKEFIDTVGYRYRSFWVANSNRPASQRKRYDRKFPADSSLLLWDGHRDSCKVTFKRDTLYAVGGSLSVDCKGALMRIDNINNTFAITSDTTISDTIQRATKVILINSDPPDSLFLDHLEDDIIKAIAWNEYAGSNDSLNHCNEIINNKSIYNPHYNNYWDLFVDSHGDTCYDTRYPCENRLSTATGTMQMLRKTWEKLFNGSYVGGDTTGFLVCSWDSLAWNWAINIFNGRYVMVDMYHFINDLNNPQRSWDSLYFPASDYSPDSTNKEDIAVYGYKWGSKEMRNIKTQDDWDDNVKKDEYVNNVRKFKDTKPW